MQGSYSLQYDTREWKQNEKCEIHQSSPHEKKLKENSAIQHMTFSTPFPVEATLKLLLIASHKDWKLNC